MQSPHIAAICNGQPEPLFGTDHEGPLSPSPTLLIEAHTGRPGDWQTRTIPAQVLTLFTEPGSVSHSAGDAAPASIFIPAQAVVFSLRGQPESVRWLRQARILAVQLDDQVLADTAEALFDTPGFELSPSSGVRDARLSALLQALHAEQASGFASGRLFVDGVEQALAALLVSHHGGRMRPPRVPAGGLPPSRAKRVVDYMHAHLDNPLRLEDLAGCSGYSASHFSRLFHETFAVTPHRYVLNLRVERAKALLARREHSILDVAQLCGFQTQQHFSRIFRQLTGESPGEFRRTR